MSYNPFESDNVRKIDISYYSDLEIYDFETLVSLSVGVNPEIINKNKIDEIYKRMNSKFNQYDEKCYSFINYYNKVRKIIESSLNNNSLKFEQTTYSPYGEWTEYIEVKPIDFINWAERKETIKLAPELIQAVKRKLNLETINYKELQEQLDQIKSENKSLKEQLNEKEDQRIISTLYKMLCGVIKKHYQRKSSRVSRMLKTIKTEAGIDISEKTLRNHIERALEEDQNQKS